MKHQTNERGGAVLTLLLAITLIIAMLATGADAQPDTDIGEPSTEVNPPRRIAGDTRIETAVLISQHRYPGRPGETDAEVVYLANADNPIDALAGGTLIDGPILLVPAEGVIPRIVLNEIRRITGTNSEAVTALGGPNAVSESTLAQARREALTD